MGTVGLIEGYWPGSPGAAGPLLRDGDAILIMMKDGEVIHHSWNMSLPHVEFVKRATGELPKGAWVGTASKLDGEVAAISSKYFFGYQLPAPPTWPRPSEEHLNDLGQIHLVQRRTILILEDNAERISAFEKSVLSFGPDFTLRLWTDAPTMVSECGDCLGNTCLISLDHDLAPLLDSSSDPGTGLDVAEFLSKQPPRCPVILHTSNHERRWSMHNEFRFAGWAVKIIPPMGADWIQTSWLPQARTLIGL